MKELKKWWQTESYTFSHMVNEDCESFTHGEVVTANLVMAAVLVAIMAIGSWLG